MTGDRRVVPFGELMEAPTRNGIHKGPAFQGQGVPVIKMGEVYGADVVGCADRDRLDLTASELNRLEVFEGDLLFCRTSLVAAGVGHCALVGRLSERTTFASNLIRVRLDRRKASPRYWFYYFRSPTGQEQLLSLARGTSVTTVTGPDIAALEVADPGLPRQRAIARILGTLDDKIELNRRMNETLEAMARALFQSWFVDFDPVRAKAAGRRPAGLAPHIADLFPDGFEQSELGEIPRGWQIWSVADVGDVVCGKTPSTKVPEYYGSDVPFITIPDMHGKVLATATERMLSHFGAASQGRKTLPRGSICVSCIATPGLVVITTQDSQTNQQINSVIPKSEHETYFWYWTLVGLRDEIRASGSGGSVVTNLSTGRFSRLKVLSPPANLRRGYHQHVHSMFGRLLAGDEESRTLTALRDVLLPELISGELRVPDAERFVKEYA